MKTQLILSALLTITTPIFSQDHGDDWYNPNDTTTHTRPTVVVEIIEEEPEIKWTGDSTKGTFHQFWADGTLHLKHAYLNGQVVEGWEYFENGNLHRHYYKKAGELDGNYEVWFENGNKEYVVSYQNGSAHGAIKRWFDNGNLYLEGNLEHGLDAGMWKYYNPDGKMSRMGAYSTDTALIIPVDTTYRLDWEKDEWGEYALLPILVVNGQSKEGHWQYWKADGTLWKEEWYENGKVVKTVQH